jgi:HD-GYP domain-containing protein (c-di-GMP phosphodiesterase class II)
MHLALSFPMETLKLSRVIAMEMGFDRERIQGIRMAAAIHDPGKIHVPAFLN